MAISNATGCEKDQATDESAGGTDTSAWGSISLLFLKAVDRDVELAGSLVVYKDRDPSLESIKFSFTCQAELLTLWTCLLIHHTRQSKFSTDCEV